MHIILLAFRLFQIMTWRHNENDGVSNHQRLDCLLNRLLGRRSKKTSKPRITGLCEGNPPVTDCFSSQRASIAENVSIWWRHHVIQPHNKETISALCYWTTAEDPPVTGGSPHIGRVMKLWPCRDAMHIDHHRHFPITFWGKAKWNK